LTAGSDWAMVGVEVFFRTTGLVIVLAMYWLMFKFLRKIVGRFDDQFGSPTLNRTKSTEKQLLRRFFCKHHVIARTRDPYLRNYTACVECGKDVNKGKPRHEWR
jgi:hypothetical protein